MLNLAPLVPLAPDASVLPQRQRELQAGKKAVVLWVREDRLEPF
jgi:hypothetical protein